MKQIPLTKGKFALVDDEDYKYLNQFKWWAKKGKKNFYAVRKNYSYKKPKLIRMHREIMNPPENMFIDHINHNGLDNQRKNLRIVTNQQNMMNQQLRKNTSSKFKGVRFFKLNKLWQSYIGHNQKQIHIGFFKKEIDAAIAYNQKAKELFGSYALLNPIPNEYKNRIPARQEQVKAKLQSNYTGVTWHRQNQKWQARIYKNKKGYFLGYFNTEEQAHKVILEMKNSLFFK